MINPRQMPFFPWLRLKLNVYLQYKTYIYVWIVSGVGPLVAMLIWAESSDTTLGGHRAVYAYFSLAFLTKLTTTIWVSDELSKSIRDGDITHRLLRPRALVWEHAAGHVAGALIRMVPGVVIALSIVVFSGASGIISIAMVPLYLVALALSWITQFSWGFSLGILGIWLSDVRPIAVVLSTCISIAGGLYAPIAFFPHSSGHLLSVLPFASVIGNPTCMLVPQLALLSPGNAIAISAAWAVASVSVCFALWRFSALRIGEVCA
ncbi:hypothetical protein [Burkholderia cepacia]|uniref:hypothetical protein n=1 Tax=Burkholderia cepacia TaxID=292 RepID=UPI00158A1CB0|nr:hypothetical protein [Burkholderia cepacia]